jgi:membrane protein
VSSPTVTSASTLWARNSDGGDLWTMAANPSLLTMADVYKVFVFEPVQGSRLSALVEDVIEVSLQKNLQEYFLTQEQKNEI